MIQLLRLFRTADYEMPLNFIEYEIYWKVLYLIGGVPIARAHEIIDTQLSSCHNELLGSHI